MTTILTFWLRKKRRGEQLRKQQGFFNINMSHINLDENLCKICREAQINSGIDVQLLLSKLTEIKQKHYYPESKELSIKEIQFLCLSLSRYSKGEIAYYFYKHKIPNDQELADCEDIERWTKNLNAEMSPRIHKYLKKLMLLDENQRLPSWKDITLSLKKSGYGINNKNSPEIKQLRMLVEGEISVEQLDDNLIKEINDFLKRIGIVNTKISQIINHD